MQKNSTQGAAILGAGFISHSHAEALRYCQVRICAVVDSSETAARAFAEKWGIETYGTSEELLFSDEITSVHVCTGLLKNFWRPENMSSAKSPSVLTAVRPPSSPLLRSHAASGAALT